MLYSALWGIFCKIVASDVHFFFKLGLLRLYLYRFKSEPLDKDNPWSNNQKKYGRRKKDYGS